MPFTGQENHNIAINDAVVLTRKYQNANAADPNLIKGVFFGKDALMKILNQTNCVGVRCYFAVNDKEQRTLVLVGASADQKDMTNGAVLEWALPCPPFCDDTSLFVK